MKIPKFIVVSAAITTSALMGVCGASAADLPARTYTKAPVVVPPPAYSWTGCYIGAEGGGVWGRSQNYAADPVDATLGVFGFPQTGGIHPTGGMVGGTLGCNYQVGNFVVGIEGDGSWTNNSGSSNLIAPFRTTDVATTNEGWIATYRARAGYAWDRLLLYATGGGASTNLGINLCDPTFGCVSSSRTVSGWAAGAGIEYAFWQNLSVKVEYLHLDFGTTYFGPSIPSTGFIFRARNVPLTDDIVRVGLNYKFGWGGPVVAKY